ncbi:MAG: cell division protein ZapA [Candidatus Eisenbacteria bacterium]|uniref:Cell division protein ZapA n=1 Tax=Eiseniibacteriota bacterium TaxID=2212470 RepID=A0A948W2U8_UNCEI|nr:cell division protein ZapA [Candidatus Eisenbacteria bacterium]MBU2690367.1 cell division protein ZapA [Candidatus Eisenbacteria bacterium]
MPGDPTTKVKILGEEYRIQGDSDAEEIQKLARFVEEMMKELLGASPITEPKRLAVLTAMNIAQKLLRERENSTQLLETLKERIGELTDRLDDTLLAVDLETPILSSDLVEH